MQIHCLYDKLLDPKDLNPHPKNRNTHPKEQIDRLAKILKYQGWRYAVKVSKLSGFVTSGHGRIEAAKQIQCQIPVVYQNYDSEEQEYADVQADNAIASWAELDLSGINADIGDLGPDFDIDVLGLKDFTIEPAEKIAQCDEDEVSEHVEPKTKLGDLYKLGSHRLLCGDSTSIDAVEKLMNDEKGDVIVTDPPYNVGKGYAGEDLTLNEFKKLHSGWLSCATMIASDDAAFYIYFGVKWLWPMADVVRQYLSNPRLLVWYRPDGYGAGGGDFFYNYDPIFYGSKTGKFHTRKYEGEFNRDVWIINKAKESDGGFEHPTVKPVKVIEGAILTSTNEGNNVLDLFGGSGSTLIACEKTNRKCFMMELDPHYVSIIIERWRKYTGQEAYRINEDGSKTAWSEIEAVVQ